MIRADTANISIVLNRPRFPENIGAAARAAKNMGIGQLILVQPEHCDLTRILKLATHVAADLVAEMEVHDDLAEALGPFHFIVGTTARTGSNRRTLGDPRRIAQELITISQRNRVALLFGPEDRSLTNDDLKYCQRIVTIPTADFSSLNLAQAVAIHCYELYHGIIHASKDMTQVPQLATSFELESMYFLLEKSLFAIDFMEKVSHTYWMSNIRNFFGRMQLTSKDANIIRGVSKKFLLQQKSPNSLNDGDP